MNLRVRKENPLKKTLGSLMSKKIDKGFSRKNEQREG